MEIKNFILKVKILKIIFLITRFIQLYLNILVGCFMLNAFIDEIIPLPIIVFRVYWVLIMLLLIFLFLNLIYEIFQTNKNILNIIQPKLVELNVLKYKDDLQNAYNYEKELSLSNLNYSKELAEKFLDDIKSRIKRINLTKIVNFDKIFKVLPLNIVILLLVFTLYALPPYVIKDDIYKIFFTRKPQTLGIYVEPGDTKVNYGNSCEIKVFVDVNYSIYEPIIYIKRSDDKKWFKSKLELVKSYNRGILYKYIISRVENRVYYKIKFRGVSTKKYKILPIVFPNIISLSIKVIPPLYSGLKPQQINSFNEMKYLKGSKIVFDGTTNVPIKSINIVFLNGSKKKLQIYKEKYFKGDMEILRNDEIYFDILDMTNRKNIEKIRYQITIYEDAVPRIQILSPNDGIVVSANEVISFLYNVFDDFGVKEIYFNYAINNNEKYKSIVIKKYDKNITESIEEYLFDLRNLNLLPKDNISVYFSVFDNDIISGPKNSLSEVVNISIFSFEDLHNIIQNDISYVDEKMLEYLDQEIGLKDMLYKVSLSIDEKRLNEIVDKNKTMKINYEKLEQKISEILERMQSDPYTSFNIYSEYNSLKETISYLKNDLKQSVIEKVEQKDLSTSLNIQDQIINTLERLSSINQKIKKQQNMDAMSKFSKDAFDYSLELLNNLKNNQLNEQQIQKLEKILNDIKNKLADVEQLLKNKEKDLPEDFINKRSVQNIDIVSPQDFIEKINSLLKSGEYSTALSYAEQLSKQLDILMNTIASESYNLLTNQSTDIEIKIEKLREQLENIITLQEEVYNITNEIENKIIENKLKQQEKLYEYLLSKIKNVLDDCSNINLHISTSSNKNIDYRKSLDNVYKNISLIKDEIERKRLIKTPDLIRETKKVIFSQNGFIDSFENESLKKMHYNLLEKINTLDSTINDSSFETSAENDKQNKNKSILKQTNNISKTNEFIAQLKALSKESFVITADKISLSYKAINEMYSAKQSMENEAFNNALTYQNSALNTLYEIRDKFSGLSQKIKNIRNNIGQPMNSTIQFSRKQYGSKGFAIGRVVLPSKNSYIASKELKENILRSLSEKYPRKYEKSIQKYLENLLK